MSMRAPEIQEVLDELSLPGTSIQQIVQPSFPNLFLHVIRPGENFWIRICLTPGMTRIHRSWSAPQKKVKAQRFAEFLRSRIRGGRISSVEHINHDRVIEIIIHNAGIMSKLYIRLWGGAGNIIVTDQDNMVLDSHYRRPNKGEVTGEIWTPQFTPPSSTNTPKTYPIRTEILNLEVPQSQGMPFNRKIFEWYRKLDEENHRKILLSELERKLSQRENALDGRLRGLEKKFRELDDEVQNQHWGDLLKSQLHLVQPGDLEVGVEDYWNPGNTITIPLDPRKNPQENLNRFFQLAKKARASRDYAEEEKLNLLQQKEQIEYWNLETNDPQTSTERLEEISQALGAKLPQSGGAKKTTDDQPGLEFTSHGYLILVGRTAKENDLLLRRYTRGNDMWLHSRDYPGGYVFIRTVKGKTIPLDVLLDAGNLAIFYSKARNSGGGDLYYTQVKYLRRPKDGKLGLVLPTQEKNLNINIDDQRLSQLFGKE